MYRFAIDKKDLLLIKKKGVNRYVDMHKDYLFNGASQNNNKILLFHIGMVVNELDFINSNPQQHRYIANKNLLNKLYSSKIDHGDIINLEARIIHFEKGCFNLLGNEIKGVLFFVQDGWYHSRINMKNSKGEYWLSHQVEFIKNPYKSIDEVALKPNSKHLYKSEFDTVIAHVCAKVCLSAIVLESLGLTSVKKGLWRNRINKYSRVNLLEYIEPSSNKTISWHFRQLRHERFYKREHENKERGSRWVFVCPDNENTEISTLITTK